MLNASSRSVTSIAHTVGGFAILFIVTYLSLYSPPISSSIQAYFHQLGISRIQSQSKHASKAISNQSQSCDLYTGRWVHDPNARLYTDSCPVITEGQNCRRNGRPDTDYENWRWRPDACELPRFDVEKFFGLMGNRTLAFVGDSLARNQMQSLLCILMAEETQFQNHGKHYGPFRMMRWLFRSSTIVARIWSSWLVDTTVEPLGVAPEGVVKVHLDVPDKNLMEFLPRMDVVVVSSGHWFVKKSAYVLNDTIVGGERWWPKEAGEMKVNGLDAFGISVETVLNAIADHPKFSGLVIVRSYSPSHYDGGAWNTGGSCMGEVRPASRVVRDESTEAMHGKQVEGFRRAVQRLKDGGVKMIMMDVTEMMSYRRDGHPGPYRSPGRNVTMKRGPNGEPPPQDCLHWCTPGAVDAWNEILLEILRREFEQA